MSRVRSHSSGSSSSSGAQTPLTPALARTMSRRPQRSMVRRTIDRWGRLDIVLANAGVNGVWAPLEELEPDEWDRTLDINLKGTFLTVKYAVPYLKRHGGSVI